MRFFRQIICKHDFTWIERRQDEVCRRCGVSDARQAVNRHRMVGVALASLLTAAAFGLAFAGSGLFIPQIDQTFHTVGVR